MKKRLLVLFLLLLSIGLVAQAQDTETSGRRTFWFGINGNFGGIDTDAPYELLDGVFGITLNTAISINNFIAVGPYVSADVFLSEDLAPFGGIMAKLTFKNNMAFLASYGVGYAEGIEVGHLYNEYRLGFKFKYTVFGIIPTFL